MIKLIDDMTQKNYLDNNKDIIPIIKDNYKNLCF